MITHCEKFSVALYYSYNQYQVKYLNKMFKFFFLLLPFAAGSFMDTETPIPLLLGSSGDDRPTTTNRDDIDIISRTSRFYFLGPQKVNWFEAHYLCQQYGMELATVESAKEEAEIEELLKPEEPDSIESESHKMQHDELLHRPANMVSGYQLQDWAAVTYLFFFKTGKPVTYHKFASGQPDNAGGKEECVEIFKYNDMEMYWNDLPCDSARSKKKFICQS
ncbi:unnamed protein product [Ceutorhynchus assimilis]|uniref:C-type lectin domain-containing protein n=1 Tax=Ceutorhynchus assimilis TaxID=467358 RepID=A0A9N9QMU7_9CUCU|nr:unnamed protein product [Ceutorhynchus assimilis]